MSLKDNRFVTKPACINPLRLDNFGAFHYFHEALTAKTLTWEGHWYPANALFVPCSLVRLKDQVVSRCHIVLPVLFVERKEPTSTR